MPPTQNEARLGGSGGAIRGSSTTSSATVARCHGRPGPGSFGRSRHWTRQTAPRTTRPAPYAMRESSRPSAPPEREGLPPGSSCPGRSLPLVQPATSFPDGEARVVEYELLHAQPPEPVEDLLGRHRQGARVASFASPVGRRYTADLVVWQPPISDPVLYHLLASHSVVHGWKGSADNPTSGRRGADSGQRSNSARRRRICAGPRPS